VAPWPELVAWFGHKPDRWEEFKRRYWLELDATPAHAAVSELRARASADTLTLISRARIEERSSARALAEYLERMVPDPASTPLQLPPRDTRARRSPKHYGTIGSIWGWFWLLMSLFSLIIAFMAIQLVAVYGYVAVAAIGATILALAAATIVRVARMQRLQQELTGSFPTERPFHWDSLLPSVAELVLTVVGTVVGIGLLLLIVVLATMLGRVL